MKKYNYHIRKDDLILVLSGRDKGKKGKVLKVLPSDSTVIVDKINVVKRHQKPTQKERNGGIIDKNIPMDISKVILICPSCDKRTRVGWKTLEDGSKARICKKCGEMIDKK
jgi:large subunit ribosomal protein L24